MSNSIKRLLIGIILLAAGGYWFLSSVTVTTGFYSPRFAGFHMNGGLVVIPFIAGIIWLFTNHRSFGAKLLTGVGLVMVFASVIAGTKFVFYSTSLYAYLLMLVFIFGGAVLVLQYVFSKGKSKNQKK